MQSLCNLVGCPLNGEWTYQSTDLWGADNGFICSWSINFDPSIIPDVTQFTPELGIETADSAAWTGPFLTLDPNDPLHGTATPTGAGDYAYTLSVTDNFGCTYDTTITVTIAPQTEIDAGPAIILCSDPLPMAGVIVANGPPEDCTYVIEMEDTWGDGWNGASLTVTVAGVPTNYTMMGPSPQLVNIPVATGASIQLTWNPGAFNNRQRIDVCP